MRVVVILAIIAALVLGFVAGAVYTRSSLKPSQAHLKSLLASAEADADKFDHGWAETMRQWQAQLVMMPAVPEPERPVVRGMYLAKIAPVGPDSTSFFADWESNNGPGEVATNTFRLRQRLDLAPDGKVFTQWYDWRYEVPVGPESVPATAFFNELASSGTTGTALRSAHWWVIVRDGKECVQLVEAPPPHF